jgi:asparagine synthase (glutamine-hydrolysing)
MERIAGRLCPADCDDAFHTNVVLDLCHAQAHRATHQAQVVTLGGACLGVVRTDQRDVADTDRQPMPNTGQSRWIVFDGVLHNQSAIAEELRMTGVTGAPSPGAPAPAAIVLRAFEEWADGCAARLRGHFAFAIHDVGTKGLVLARDRLGTKPLYYTIQDRHIYFASEIAPLLPTLYRLKVNRAALLEWCLYRSLLGSDELIEGVRSVPPGHIVHLRDGQLISSFAYHVPESDVDETTYRRYATDSPASIFAELARTLEASIEDGLRAGAPVATMLSGGLDSSLMTALAMRGQPVIAVNVSVPGNPALDEHHEADATARFLGVPLALRALDRETFLTSLPMVIRLNEGPLTHIQSVAFHVGAQLAREHGARCLLVGDAADTLLGGNWARQRVLLRLARPLAHLPRGVRRALDEAMRADGLIPVRPFINPEGFQFVDGYARQRLRERCEQAYGFVRDGVERAILAAKLIHLAEDVGWYLQRGDRLGAEASLEYVAPYLDQRLVRMAVNLPSTYHTHGTTDKWALRRIAARRLPRRIAYRRKVAWDLPLQAYLAPLASVAFFHDGVCAEVFGLDRQGVDLMVQTLGDHLSSFYNFVNIEIWGRLFLWKHSVEQVADSIAQVRGR